MMSQVVLGAFPDPGETKAPFEMPTEDIVGIQVPSIQVTEDLFGGMLDIVPQAPGNQTLPITRFPSHPFLDLRPPVCLQGIKKLV